MHKIIVLISLILLSVSSIIYCGDIKNKRYDSRIIREKHDSKVTLIAEFMNNDKSPVNISYKFNVVKEGRAGNSSNLQSGSENIKANSKKELSKVIYNIGQKDLIQAYLMILKDGVTISIDSADIRITQ